MFTGFAHSELLSLLWPQIGIAPVTLTTGQTVNTYSASPQPAAGIDTWDGGGLLFKKMLMVINVASITTGILTVSLRDAKAAITTGNGDANTYEIATLATISAAGLYLAEINFAHCFASTLARSVADSDNESVRRYQSVRALAGAGTSVFSIMCLYGFNSRGFPEQDGTALAITYVAA